MRSIDTVLFDRGWQRGSEINSHVLIEIGGAAMALYGQEVRAVGRGGAEAAVKPARSL